MGSVKAMKLSSITKCRVLPITVLGALILCQVLGALCTMPSLIFSSEEAAFLAPQTHMMPMSDNPCQDSLISSESSSKKVSQHVITLSGHALTACIAVGWHRNDLAWLDHPPKHSVQTSPSVLRL
jgi:hypothetical protein